EARRRRRRLLVGHGLEAVDVRGREVGEPCPVRRAGLCYPNRRENVRTHRQGRLLLAAEDADPRRRVHDDVRLEACEPLLRGAVTAARRLQSIVATAAGRVGHDQATGRTAVAKKLLLAALEARRGALAVAPDGGTYRRDWNRSVVDARRALTLMQDIRDRARLIPLPEDSVS